jgi:uncharacterized protein (UPF0303 family)
MSEDTNFSASVEEQIAHDSHQYIAFILDGKVQYVLGTDIYFSAILQSEPVIKDITMRQDRLAISIGTEYDSENDNFHIKNNIV